MPNKLPRRETIVHLLETYNLAKQAAVPGRTGAGDGENVPGMAKIWREGSYEELEWCLGQMRKFGKQYAYMGESWQTLRAHVVMWWINVERTQRWVPKVALKGKRLVVVQGDSTPIIEIRRNPDAREQKAQWGVDVIDQILWPNERGEPFLPREIYEQVAA